MKALKHFILVGGPGSGKGTQARFLSGQFGLKTLSTGALLRGEIEKNSEIGKRAQNYMDQAKFVPDEIVNQVVQNWLQTTEDSAWLLDGYPRTIAQAEMLDNMLSHHHISIDCVVWMDATRDLIEQRILRRRECESCHHVVQESLDICPLCHGKMITRKDDNLIDFARRWKDFESMTLPVAKHYEEQNKVVKISINHECPSAEVSQNLFDKLNQFVSKSSQTIHHNTSSVSEH